MKEVLARQAAVVRPIADRIKRLGRDDDLVAPGVLLQRAPGDLFARAERVHVGGVEEVDAVFQRTGEKRLAGRFVEHPLAPLRGTETHAPEADPRHFQTGRSEIDVVHVSLRGELHRRRRRGPRHAPGRIQKVRNRQRREAGGRPECCAETETMDDPAHGDRTGTNAGIERREDPAERGATAPRVHALQDIGSEHLVIDVRANGGGSVTNSTLLTKFIADKEFKVADSLYANTRNSRYKKYIDGYFFNRIFMVFMTSKKKDEKYHFGYFERHYFKPKKKKHFDGKVYILTGGNSFSATTLFTQIVKPQDNVTVVGEETGGGAYGNTAWLIPDLTLPETGVRFRLPLFRLVIDKDIPKDGRGVQPEVNAGPTTNAIRRGVDYKMEKVMELIKSHY